MKPLDKTLAAWLVELCQNRHEHKKVDMLVRSARHIVSTAGNPYFLHDNWTECEVPAWQMGQEN